MQGASVPGAAAAQSFGSRYVASGRVVFVVNTDRGFWTHRAVWALAFKGAGASVTVVAPESGYGDRIKSLGFEYVNMPIGREDVSPSEAIVAMLRLLLLLVRLRPTQVFLIQTAAYALGWPAAVFLRRTRFHRVAGGVGRALVVDGARRRTAIIGFLLRCGARLSNVDTIFQLEEDRARFLTQRYASESRSVVVPGTGLPLEAWPLRERRSHETPIVMFASRLYEEKGPREFLELARAHRDRDVRYVIVGAPDPGVSSSIGLDEIRAWAEEGCVEWWGHTDDIGSALRQALMLVFPTRHPEGTPKILIEAAASGVPAVASDIPGCRAVIHDEVTGWLVPPNDQAALEQTVSALLAHPERIERAGTAARQRVEREFSFDAVMGRIFEVSGIERELSHVR